MILLLLALLPGVWTLVLVAWGVIAAYDAVGTYHFREHVREMAPYAFTMLALALIVRYV